jgi:diacylglycerol kinase (ATP)
MAIMEILCKLYNSFVWSCAGLKYAFKADLSFRMELCAAVFLIPLSLLVAHSKSELILLIMSIFMVLIAELINTAIETVVNRISLEQHILSKHAKDVGSAVVFCSLLFSAIVWGICIF